MNRQQSTSILGKHHPREPQGSEFKRGLENSLRDFNMLFGISQRAFEPRLHIGSTLYAHR